MKNLSKLAVFSVVLTLTSQAFAWDTTKNPDRFLSIGLNYDAATVDGGYGPKLDEDRYLKIGENITKTSIIQLDIRLPLSNKLTVEGRVRGIAVDDRFNSDYPNDISSVIFDGSGSGFGVGLRYYFSR
jgi:hypothetical protein